jgi:hypothetical protein
VQLNPEAVERYLTNGDFEPVDRQFTNNLDVKDVVMLGSTTEQTTIYASISMGVNPELLARRVARDTVKLLRFMGASAILDNSPTPGA